MKKIINLLSIGAFALTLASCGGGQSSGKKKLYVGLECNYAPFNWTENTSTESNYPIDGSRSYAEGYDIQIAKIIAEELDMELVIKKLEWDALIPSVQTGIIDLIIAGMSPTESRKLDIDFTNPYYTSQHVLLVKANGDYANITSVSELEGARISGQIGTLYDDIAHAIPGALTGSDYDRPTVPEIITLLQTDLIDGTVLEYPVAQGLVAADSSLKVVTFSEGNGFTQLEDGDTGEIRDIVDTDRDVSIGLEKGRNDLKDQINEILADISTEQRNTLMSQAVENNAD